MQIAKNTAFPVNGVYHPCNAIPEGQSGFNVGVRSSLTSQDDVDDSALPIPGAHTVQTGIEVGHECGENVSNNAVLGRNSTGTRRIESPG